MTNQLMPFDFEGFMVRVVTREGEPWFVLADVCRVLEIANPRDAVSRLDDDEKIKIDLKGVGTTDGAKINGLGSGAGNNEVWLVNESGLYSLILTSRKQTAKRFKKWITADVLPTLRKTGKYQMPGTAAEIESVHAFAQQFLGTLSEQAAALRGLQEEIAELRTIRDPRAATSDYRAAIDVVMSLQALPKGRRTLAKRAGDGMARISALWQVPVKLCPVTRRRMFSAAVADHWIEKAGRQMVRDHNAAAVGQGVFSFEQERRRRHRNGAEDAGPPPASS